MGMTIGNGHKAEINMTPMIDVLLVLIIIFMVITPIASRGLRTVVPEPPKEERGPAPLAPTQLVVTVHAAGALELNQQVLTMEELKSKLDWLYRNGVNRPLFVRGDKDVDFAQVAAVIDTAHMAGIYTIALMTT